MIRASGVRIDWAGLPPRVQAAVGDVLGSPVVRAVSQPGGFSPGTADRVVTASGARAFVKAVSPAQNPDAVRLHRQEIAISRALAPGPVPRFLGSYDDGTWVALILADVDGQHPVTPWDPGELAAVLATLEQIARTMPAPDLLPDAVAGFERVFGSWQNLVADPDPALPIRAPWAAERIGWLLACDDQAWTVIPGNSLVHMDIRADNLLLTPGGEVVLVDWPHACRGAPWLDAVLLLINVRLYGDRTTTHLLRQVCAAYGIPLETAVVYLAACLGYFLDVARRPAPPGLPTVRAFQRAQADALLGWLPDLVAP